MKRQLHLNLFIHSRGHHEASWRHRGLSPRPLTDIHHYQDLAQRAETALFDSLFLADQLALGGDVAQAPRIWLEPITVLAAVAAATSRVGLIATASTTYTEPFNLARQFASIDHISNGRAAWNIVTSWLATAAENYGGAGQMSHTDRYARGEEFMEVVKALWDSWAADAVVDDRSGGIYGTRTAFGRSITAVISTMWPGPSTCRAAHRDGRCWCRRARPTPVAASLRGMPMPCSPLTWRRRRRKNSTPI
jgi:alkanesulfonate monooxygenase SsuD/methylene tetrahydromethanopterin reductase-like flavin-dependent oxidoreductase (luciferase family)